DDAPSKSLLSARMVRLPLKGQIVVGDINRLSVVRKRIIHLIAASSERISLAGRAGTGAGRFEELDRIRHHFGHLDPPTFAVFKAPDLKPSIHSDQTSLFQVVGAGLGLLPPGDD